MRIVVLFIVAMVSWVTSAQALDKPNLSSFGAWPVLHEGRIKTMDGFARSVFYDISGKEKLDDITAIEWLTNTLFDPSSTIPKPFIAVGKKSILDLPERESDLYSMAEVMTALDPYQDMVIALEKRDPNEYSASQKDLMQVYHAVSLYNQIIQSFSAVLPLHGQERSYIDGGGEIIQRDLIATGGKNNTLLKIIPTDNPTAPLISLWESIATDTNIGYANEIKIMAKAWNEGNYAMWNDLAYDMGYNTEIAEENSFRLTVENIYISYPFVTWIIVCYVIALIVFYYSTAASLIAIWLGFVLHNAVLIMRVFILARPPTGTLYETLLFGSAIIVMVGLLVWWVNKKQNILPLICAGSAAFLLFVSRGFIQGDSLNVLVAVLNTNFWLSTHVTCIIIGYGFCIITAMVAHVALAFHVPDIKKTMLPLALCALLFTSVGTLLGGIWADQSWGRFWGWDPKENGALLIVLWLAWVLHGRVSGHFKERSFAAALALTNIMVAVTWFGVNLLGVGLHSYGFISGIAWGLGSFIVIQIVIVLFLYFLPQLRKRHA